MRIPNTYPASLRRSASKPVGGGRAELEVPSDLRQSNNTRGSKARRQRVEAYCWDRTVLFEILLFQRSGCGQLCGQGKRITTQWPTRSSSKTTRDLTLVMNTVKPSIRASRTPPIAAFFATAFGPAFGAQLRQRMTDEHAAENTRWRM